MAEREGEAGAFFVNDVVLVELMWVLGRLYGFERSETLGAVKSLLGADAFAFEDRERLERVVDLCSQQACDFADTLIALKNKDAACEFTASFDRAMRGLPGVRVL